MHFPTSWQTLANETPVDTPLLSCTSIVSVGCLIKRSALLDLGPGLYSRPLSKLCMAAGRSSRRSCWGSEEAPFGSFCALVVTFGKLLSGHP
eukprot:Skav206671  [mRNA]  locus=scaffold1895:19377:19652:+ [translate_table: standard]